MFTTARRFCVCLLCAVVASLATAAAASATENLAWYWFNGGTQNCWQTGKLGSPSSGCDNLSEKFLEVPGRFLNGGIGQNVELNPSGDYCSYYGLSDTPNKQDGNYEGGFTGLGTPSPYGGYQRWDGHGNLCQAWEQFMGQGVNKAYCSAHTCGAHHYVSLHEQGYSDRPWTSLVINPELVVSAQAIAQTVAPSSSAGWGYLCPVFQDAQPPHDILEYCLQEWRGGGNAKPEWETERIGSCANGPAHNAIDTVQTFFYPGTQFATNLGAQTGVDPSGWKTYSAKISEANLKTAIEMDRRPYKEKAGNGSGEATPELGYGCGRALELSASPAEYALIGVEQGAEAWTFEKIGSAGGSINLHTEYTPRPPSASTGSATGIHETQATLNGTVNPNGSDTHYHFEYGTTISYGSATNSTDAGSSTSQGPVSTLIGNLLPGTKYHYRIVASNSGGTSYGSDATVTTLDTETSARWVVRDASSGSMWVYFRGADGTPWSAAWNGSNWTSGSLNSYGMASGTSTTVVRDPSTSAQWVYYQAQNGELWDDYWSGSSWTSGSMNTYGMAAGTNPTIVRDSSSGSQWVYYEAKNGELWNAVWNGSSWTSGSMNTYGMAAGTSPTVVRDPSTGSQWVYYEAKNGELWNAVWNGSSWTSGSLNTYGMAAGTSPTVVRDPSTGSQWLYYQAQNGALWTAYWSGSSWTSGSMNTYGMAAGTSPTVVRDPGSGVQAVYYKAQNGELWNAYWSGSSWSSGSLYTAMG